MSAFDSSTFTADLRVQLDAFIDDHRAHLAESLDDLSEQEARRRLVPSKTTLLGLVKHATFVEKVWFDEAITGRSRAEIGLPDHPDGSFDLDDADRIGSIRDEFEAACDASRRRSAELGLDDIVSGNRRGPLPWRFVLLHVLREHAHHCGHADILREQVLAARRAGN